MSFASESAEGLQFIEQLVNRDAVEAHVCECYRVVKSEGGSALSYVVKCGLRLLTKFRLNVR